MTINTDLELALYKKIEDLETENQKLLIKINFLFDQFLKLLVALSENEHVASEIEQVLKAL